MVGGLSGARAISPLDGRYGPKLAHLAEYFSELALMRARCLVELDYVEALCAYGPFSPLSDAERARIEAERAGFSDADFEHIKAIERTIGHDVKAVELHLRQRLGLNRPSMIHFGLTSEDVNNLAYGRLLRAYVEREQLPLLDRLLGTLCDRARAWQHAPFPAHTHGQRATPTTAGKEVAVFLSRLLRHRRELASLRLRGKLGGATGTHAAALAAFPSFDWLAFAHRFVGGQGLELNWATTQIEDHDSWASYFDLVRRTNGVLLDLAADGWLYLALGLWRAMPAPHEVGSSTMPHKVNPIHFENAEGNLRLANALLAELSSSLTRSRLQRDLSDSTLERNIGVALVHSYLGMLHCNVGLERVALDETRCLRELRESPELLAEPIQTILRTTDLDDPYEVLRRATQGREVTLPVLHALIDSLPVDDAIKGRLRALRVETYVGLAPTICDAVLRDAEEALRPKAEGERT